MSAKACNRLFRNALAFLAFSIIFCKICFAEDDVIVEFTSGKVRGFVAQSSRGRNYFAFRGIPFAKPPIGPLRFKPPEKVEPWPDIFDATQIGKECPQMMDFIPNMGYLGDEDCLNLNVYTPILPSEDPQRKLPVMVFIHGGAFALGSASPSFYKADHFMDHELILVTINYRLGVLGFLNTEDESATGNYGMLDQVLALKWVRENVATFGGDLEKVLIFGESAGSASVLYHFISPLSQGLFSTALAQSGSPLNPWAFAERPLSSAKKLADVVNCPKDSTRDLVRCLEQKSAKEIVLGGHELAGKAVFPMVFSPSVQKYGKDRFLPEDPASLLKKTTSKIPIIIGLTSSEGYLSSSKWKDVINGIDDENLDKAFSQFISSELPLDPNLAKPIISRYFSGINQNDKVKFEEKLTLFASDYLFDAGIAQAIDFLSDSGIPVWTYQYTHVGDHSILELFGPSHNNFTVHGDDLFVHFGNVMKPLEGLSESDKVMSDILISTWLNFVQNGEPTITANDDVIQWQKYDKSKPNYMDLNLSPELKTGKLCENVNFWATEIPKIMQVINDMKALDENLFKPKQKPTHHKTEL